MDDLSVLEQDYNIVMQEASDALCKTADSDTVSTYQVSSVQLVTDKKLYNSCLIQSTSLPVISSVN